MSLFKKLYNKLPDIGQYSSIPAGMIDKLYLEAPKSPLGHVTNFFKIRAIYAFLFFPLSIVDLATSAALGMRYSFGTFLLTDSLQEKRLGQQKKYATLFSKNLYAISLFVLGLIAPKLVAFYFTPERKDKKGVHAGGDLYFSEEALRKEPESVEEVQSIIADAAQSNKKVIPIGAGLSQGKQYLPDGKEVTTVLDLKNLDTVEINSEDKVAIVGAGARWSDIQLEANKHKLALQVMQASNIFSVGGSIGTNIHGWDHTMGMLSNTVESIDIVNAKGELQTLTPQDDLFHKVFGGLGLFGTVVRARIKLTDNDLLKARGVDVEPNEYVNYFRNKVQTNPNIHMHLYRLSLDPTNLLGAGVAVNYTADDETKPVKTNDLKMEPPRGIRLHRIAVNILRRFEWLRRLYWHFEARSLVDNVTLLSRNEIMQPPINAMLNPSISESEWLQEYFLPEEGLDSFRKDLAKLLMDNGVPLINATIRFVKQNDKSPLSYAHDGDRYAVVLCFNQSLQPNELIKAQKWLRQSQALAIKHGGTYYLPYQHVSSPEDFKKAYPYAQEAMHARDEIDPNHVFSSGLATKYLKPAQENKPNYFKELMGSEEYKKHFKGFLTIVLKRVDCNKLYALLEDILQYKDSHEEIYMELGKRLPEIMPNGFTDFNHILDSLSAIKADLSNQAHTVLPMSRKTINGLVEIGYPGRFVAGFKEHYNVQGQIVAVYEGQSMADYVQTGFPRPYHRFEKLDYAKPNLKNLADKSADVITCYVGLHHFTEEELPNFLKDVRRVLRDGGRFLLVDHDINNDETMCMAHMAHTIFNAVTGASVEEEMGEVRNFRSMAKWKEILAEYGLGYTVEGPDVPMIRKDDPSRNRMVSFEPVAPKPKLQSIILATPSAVMGGWRQTPATLATIEARGLFAATYVAGVSLRNYQLKQQLDNSAASTAPGNALG